MLSRSGKGLVLLVAMARAIAVPAAMADVTVNASRGMVVSAQHEATAAGARILRQGGNAIDAAVAVGYALAVVDPCCGNIGGGGFMLIRLADGRTSFLDFRETAPAAATRDMFLDAAGNPLPERSLYGYRAAAVPGTVAGLDQALMHYGHLSRGAVMAPAIALARDGFVLGEADAATLEGKIGKLSEDPVAARVFLKPDGGHYRAGDRLVQADLATTLAAVAEHGPQAFYRGAVAQSVAAASVAAGGLLSAADFTAYRARERAPVRCAYRGLTIVSAPPPSSGGAILCEMLNVLSGWDMAGKGLRTAASAHLFVETMRHAYFDRNTALGDPDFVDDPVARLLSPEHAAAIRAAIDPDKATPSAMLRAGEAPHERAQTTHYSVVDGAGNAVAVTYTVNGNFGAAVMAPGTGFVLNNEMDDFTTKAGTPNLFGLVQGEANAIAPGKRPLSSMTPTIVEQDGHPVLVLGSPGGSRIITTVLETLTGIVDYRLSPEAAVAAPRFHHQWLPDTVHYEQGAFSPETIAVLTGMGYRLVEQGRWGAVELIAIGPDGMRTGVSDPRRPAGAAMGE